MYATVVRNTPKQERKMWANIPNIEGYQASETGQIKSLDRVINHCNGEGQRILKGRILKATISNTGYKYVSISLDGESKKMLVHRLVCAAFHGDSKKIVNHKDGNKLNNSKENLEWCTYSENNKHALRS